MVRSVNGRRRGLRRDGTIEREGALGRIAAVLAAGAGRTLSADPAVLRLLIDDLGAWLAADYTAVHGAKAPRPEGVS